MRTTLVVASLALLSTVGNSPARESNPVERPQESRSPVQVHPTVELGLVLVALTPLGEGDSNYNPVRREGPYYEALLAWFADFREHPAVTGLGADFNLPRLAGNAADFRLEESGELTEVDTAGSLWGDRRGDLFRRHRAAIEDFARITDFRDFFEDQRERYAQDELATSSMIDLGDMTRWLEGQFSVRPRRAEVYVSPLLHGHHWAGGGDPRPVRLWVAPPKITPGKTPTDLQRLTFARSVFTELDHPYVNPTAEPLAGDIEAALAERERWTSDRAWKSYPSRQAVFNEYMTWAVFLLYARDRSEPGDFATLRARVVFQMQMRRGFKRFGSFVDHALAQDAKARAEDLLPALVTWCASQDG